METVTEYVDHKTELEERLRSLEAERTSLLNDISALKDRVATFELEKATSSLENEVEALRTEKAVLEEKVSTYTSEGSFEQSQPSTPEGYQV
jgi:predicted  nucleic acid-binding Zn-ribbon protein